MKRHVRNFDNFKKSKLEKNQEKSTPIQENVMETGNTLKVITTIDVPTSLVNAYAKKAKDTFDKDVLRFYGRDGVAEELVKWVGMNKLNIDEIPAGALTGDEEPQVQPEAQPQVQAQVQPEEPQMQAQPQEEPQAQPQAQGQMQAQTEPQAQPELQTQAQPEEVQGQSQTDFEEVQAQESEEGDEELEETDEEEGEGEEELPL